MARTKKTKTTIRDHIGALAVADDADLESRHAEAWAIRAAELTPERRAAIARSARSVLCKRSLFRFFVESWHVLEPDTPLELNWHHRMLCDHVQAMLEDWLARRKNPGHRMRVQNAVFNFPPGTTKSRIISVIAPAWMWLRCPSWSVICLSANPVVATRDAMLARDLVTSEWYRSLFGTTWTIRDDVDAKTNYRNTAGGSRVSLGISSRIVGSRANAVIIDDPDDMVGVFSESERRRVHLKIDHGIWNRVNDQRDCLRFVIQQRGHVDDTTGHLIKTMGTDPSRGGIMHVPVPMEFDPDLKVKTPFGYHDPRTLRGELLHAKRFTVDFVMSEKVRLGAFGHDAQNNQNPRRLEGNLFKRDNVRFFRLETSEDIRISRPDGCRSAELAAAFVLRFRPKSTGHWTQRLDVDWIVISVDASFGSTSQSASQVGLLVIAGKGALRFVLDDRTAVMDSPQMFDAIDLIISDYPGARRVLVEKKANGNAIIQMFRRKYSGFIGIDPEGGKSARAAAMAPGHESGNWMLLDGATWLRDHVDEFALFDRGPYDDRVDAASQVEVWAMSHADVAAAWNALSH